MVAGLPTQSGARRFALNVIVATIPAVILGVLFERIIKGALYSPVPVAFALVMGGVVILWAEARQRKPDVEGKPVEARVRSIDDLTLPDALKVGFAQCFALIPGMSRSGSTIIGGMLSGSTGASRQSFRFSSRSDHVRRGLL